MYIKALFFQGSSNKKAFLTFICPLFKHNKKDGIIFHTVISVANTKYTLTLIRIDKTDITTRQLNFHSI